MKINKKSNEKKLTNTLLNKSEIKHCHRIIEL